MMFFSLGMLLPLSSSLLVMLFVCHGMSIASTSGADDGIFYRTVLRGDDAALERIRPLSVGLNYASLGAAAVLGGVAAEYGGWRSVFGGFAVAALASMASSAMIRGPSIVTERESDESTSLTHIYQAVISYPKLCLTITLFALMEACANVVFIYAQLRSSDLGLSLMTIGIAMGAVEVASAAGAFGSRWVDVGSASFRCILALLVASLAASCFATNLVFIGAILFFLFFATLLKVLGETLIVIKINTALTATALSLFSLVIALCTGCLHLLFALCGNALSEQNIMTILLGLCFVAAVPLALMEKASD